ncbi:transglutaminase-like domain-containing protein [Nibricoccus sp. IMCC34717]|uniref:transglutaminase-like domain-containing protein n=1 Tax=Nibricoccus sp. IMCC34717 TaxID=3034021 RepID=UPI00384F099A
MSLAPREALLDLLDDTQPAVRRALLQYFQKEGTTAVDFLRELANGHNRVVAFHARWFLDELQFSDPVAEFKGFIRSLSHDLETGALLLCRVRHPDANTQLASELLDHLAQRCRELITEPMTVREKCRVLNRVLFHEHGLHGNKDHYSDPLNSFIDQVLLRRKGIPISLSLVYLFVARRLGLPLEPVGLPGHFVVGCFTEEPVFFVDTFERGLFYSPTEVSNSLRSHPIAPKTLSFGPTPTREVLCRCCRNLVLHYAAANQADLSRLFADLVDEFEKSP